MFDSRKGDLSKDESDKGFDTRNSGPELQDIPRPPQYSYGEYLRAGRRQPDPETPSSAGFWGFLVLLLIGAFILRVMIPVAEFYWPGMGAATLIFVPISFITIGILVFCLIAYLFGRK